MNRGISESASRVPVAVLVAVACLACASSGSGLPGEAGGRDVISESEIASTDARNAYEAVESLRPLWLQSRGSASIRDPEPTLPPVFVDGTEMGGIDYLRNIDITDVRVIRYMSSGEASNRHGMGYPRGIIEVVSETGGEREGR